jgi:hypothetical protein
MTYPNNLLMLLFDQTARVRDELLKMQNDESAAARERPRSATAEKHRRLACRLKERAEELTTMLVGALPPDPVRDSVGLDLSAFLLVAAHGNRGLLKDAIDWIELWPSPDNARGAFWAAYGKRYGRPVDSDEDKVEKV